MRRKGLFIGAIVAVLAVIAAIVAVAVLSAARATTVTPGMQPPSATPLAVPAHRDGPVDPAQAPELEALSQDPALGEFFGIVTDVQTGETVWEKNADVPGRPASITKVLTATAAVHALPAGHRLVTEVYADGDTSYIKAGGDVWLSDTSLDRLAGMVTTPRVVLDTSVWDGFEPFAPTWDPADIDAGFVAPIEPVMINQARIDATTGDVPRSHTPAQDVLASVAARSGATPAGLSTVPPTATKIGTVESPRLDDRLNAMMDHSDNVMAEAIGRELAVAKGATNPVDAVIAELHALSIPTDGLNLNDCSGLSADNRIAPRTIDIALYTAATDDKLHPVLRSLPVAYGSGTLAERFGGKDGQGWVRAKTGTLDATSGLAGTVTGEDGSVYTFAFLSNGSDILAARESLDTLASALRK
ncbi:D-alanyl-D-alanine carboxypeptidase/D-alanyl-D-alanine endopeptidase [Corynebacterium glucuronolyticum]|uniref:D-alanyl-D-alanine carboxypeptidase/D-alanyl-D-alanine endopeptidase n=1 Tax=Corynebacterium glucuronolyticum TaxID=39791 RepID=UPI00019C1C34|nr:D-alanyl-D-alanine carboxypeptidase/D-alanyl-D-alanine-endopeptidase [Corynebacterium glucuronolyticum]EEI26022.1 D-alanyl-D-alanine carboxypeptidase/D-alanyl-D-alanine-endopeptidase [Corynebacterium glucuronolyticum ATCC 51867]QRO82491.1 D-alanyl-D-alanine carboxypeptidase/D-alanyl-D-alanine-endopeptidase [Corynebacterium glucuronolyticum]